jgi:hypothetical protein
MARQPPHGTLKNPTSATFADEIVAPPPPLTPQDIDWAPSKILINLYFDPFFLPDTNVGHKGITLDCSFHEKLHRVFLLIKALN